MERVQPETAVTQGHSGAFGPSFCFTQEIFQVLGNAPTPQASRRVSSTPPDRPWLPELLFASAGPCAGNAARGHSPGNHLKATVNDQDARFILTYQEEKMPLQLKAEVRRQARKRRLLVLLQTS